MAPDLAVGGHGAVGIGLPRARSGYDGPMSEPENEPNQPSEAEKDLAEHERPEKGLISDEELPEDLRPTDDNPLAKDPEEGDDTAPA